MSNSAAPWTVAPLSVGVSKQEYWSAVRFHSPRILSNPGIEARSPALQADSLPSEPPGNLPFLALKEAARSNSSKAGAGSSYPPLVTQQRGHPELLIPKQTAQNMSQEDPLVMYHGITWSPGDPKPLLTF